MEGYNFAYLDEQTKRMLRRSILKAIALPGHQVPFASREMPLPYGWGTGGIQVTAALLGRNDRLKVIDQGADDTVNAIAIRKFFRLTAAIETTSSTRRATIIQTRHRIPETPLHEGQVLVYQVPQPEPLALLEPRRAITRKMHANADYDLIYVKLYEDLVKYGRSATSYNYPMLVNGRYLIASTPVPVVDSLRMNRMAGLQLFGAGREKRIYAIPPYTTVQPIKFDDVALAIDRQGGPCSVCGSETSFLEEVLLDDIGTTYLLCSDTDYCASRSAGGAQP